jgi:hypothetical protein
MAGIVGELTKVLVAYDRGQLHGIPIRTRICRYHCNAKVFNNPEYRPDHDQSRTQVHGKQHAINIPVLDAAVSAAAVEYARNDDEAEHDKDLSYKGGFHEDVAEVLLTLLDVGIDKECDAKSVEHFDEKGKRAEGGEGTAGVQRRMVWNIVEDAAQDVIIC